MVKGFMLCLLLLQSLFIPAQAATSSESDTYEQRVYQTQSKPEIHLNRERIHLGDAVTFVMKGEHLGEAMAKIDLQMFTKDFVIDDVRQSSESLRIRLYPLMTGKLSIAEQMAGHVKIPELTVMVEPNPEVKIEWVTPADEAYSQQMISWLARVEVADPAFKVEYATQAHNSQPEVEVLMTPLSVAASKDDSEAALKTHLLVSGYKMPDYLKPGFIQIHSPVVEVKNTSHKRWKFFDASKQVKIKTLPSFLPMSAPIAKIDWQIEALGLIHEAGALKYWTWHLKAQNLSADYLKGTAYRLLSELNSAQNLQFLSETMSVNESYSELGLISELKVDVPYRALNAGWMAFPELNLRYFDPNTGKVGQSLLPTKVALTLPSWIIWLLQWLLLVVVLVLFFALAMLTKQQLNNWRFKNSVNAAMRSDKPIDVLWLAMLAWQAEHRQWKLNLKTLLNRSHRFSAPTVEHAEPIPSHSSFAQWQNWYQFFYGDCERLQRLFVEMNRYFYQQEKTDKRLEEEIMALALKWLKQI